MQRILSLGLVALLSAIAPAGSDAGGARTPLLPEVRQHLSEGRACLQSDPAMARAHAMAVLVSDDLAVEIRLDKVPSTRRTACKAAMDEALEAWEKALDGSLKLHRASDGESSGIVVRFQPDVRQDGEPVAGYVNWKRKVGNGQGAVTGDVQIRCMNLDGAAMSQRAMRHIVIHEMGHLLGLDDTDRTGDAMGPLDVDRPVSQPTKAETAAVRALRAEAETLLSEAGRN